jgi:hypothetical protein
MVSLSLKIVLISTSLPAHLIDSDIYPEYIGVSGIDQLTRSEHRIMLEKARQLQQHGKQLNDMSSHLAVPSASNNDLEDWNEVEVVVKKSHWYKSKIFGQLQ